MHYWHYLIVKIICSFLNLIIRKDWSNDAENPDLITAINYKFNRHSHRKQLFLNDNNIHYFSSMFDQINAALVSSRDLLFTNREKQSPPVPLSQTPAAVWAPRRMWPAYEAASPPPNHTERNETSPGLLHTHTHTHCIISDMLQTRGLQPYFIQELLFKNESGWELPMSYRT